jgi:O-antigen/teichoic acid export membrane protein
MGYSSEEPLLSFSADRRTITKSSINSIIVQLLLKLKGIITMPIMTYYLLPKEMGIYNLIVVTATMLTPVFFLNLADGPAIYLVQERSKNKIKAMYNTVVSSSFLIFFICAIIFSVALYKFNLKFYDYFYLVLALIFSNIFYKLFSYILVVFQKTTLLVKNTLFKDISTIILTILLVILGFSYKGIIYALVAANIIAGILIYNFIKDTLPLRLYINKKILLKFLKISLPLLPVFFFSWLIQSSGSYFLLFFKGSEAVGKYAVIYGISSTISIFAWALNFFWGPISAKLWVANREKYKNFFISLFASFSAFLLMAVFMFELNSKVIVQLLARNAKYYDAYIIMGIIAAALSLEILIVLLIAPLYSNKNPKHILIAYIIGGFLNSALNFLLIPSSGIMGAAVSMAISYLVVGLLLSYFNYRIAKFSFLDKRIIYILLIFSIGWFFIVYLRNCLSLLQVFFADIALILTAAPLVYFKFLKEKERAYLYLIYKENIAKS